MFYLIITSGYYLKIQNLISQQLSYDKQQNDLIFPNLLIKNHTILKDAYVIL